MRKLTSKEVRKVWLDFFQKHGHFIEKSARLIPVNDNTLLWINAGVAPLKKYFDGREKPLNPRITNVQKCIRTNDIDNVGRTARHHTFFEMLGNFSIGDYFKKEALTMAYELLFSKEYFGFEVDKMYMTYYTKDIETKNYWLSLNIKEDHLIPLDGNFWEIGEGPCGPCTEFFYDRGEKYDKRGKELIEQDIENDRFIEIWNIVFSQYNSKEGLKRSEYKELPSKNIDTGSGLERMCLVLQEVETNYETDLFMPIIKKIEEISNISYNGQMAFKVISDHVRTIVFALSDGAVFSNEGRGYVLRRIIRRAAKYAKKLNINRPFMDELVDTVSDIMSDFYKDIKKNLPLIKRLIKIEEEKFLQTLENGEKRFEIIASKSEKEISGVDAFLLYDTFGFPIELTCEYASEVNLEVDLEGFYNQMQIQKDKSRASLKQTDSMNSQNEEYLNFKESSIFVGYEVLNTTSKVIKVFAEGIVLDKTPFYAFSGGQSSDKGFINDFEVIDCIKLPNGQHLHKLKDHNLKENDIVEVRVDEKYRNEITINHSCCHLLHQALKDILGNHVNQQGSLITSNYLRFDFNNYQSLDDETILKIEKLVNQKINEAYTVNTNIMSIDDAKKTKAIMLFDEKYQNEVRVVDMNYSIELCGGTHVSNTSNIKRFVIMQIESIGSGIYRILGTAGDNIKDKIDEYTKNIDLEIDNIASKINELEINNKNINVSLVNLAELRYNNFCDSFEYILHKKKVLQIYNKNLFDLNETIKRYKSQEVLKNLSIYDKYIKSNTLVHIVDIEDLSLLKELTLNIRNNKSLDLCFLACVNNDKVTYMVSTSDKHDSNLVISKIKEITNVKGGGKKDFSQAGGPNVDDVEKVLDFVNKYLGF